MDVLKKGYRVAMMIGVVGFLILCFIFLDYKGSWLNFACCGLIGQIVSYLFIELTQYYTDYRYAPV